MQHGAHKQRLRVCSTQFNGANWQLKAYVDHVGVSFVVTSDLNTFKLLPSFVTELSTHALLTL